MAFETPDIQVPGLTDAASPQTAPGANVYPVVPGTGLPVPPTQAQPAPAAPDLGTGGAPGSFGQRLSDALSAAAAQPGAPQAIKQPGGFAKLFLGASLDALGKGGNAGAPHGLGVGIGIGGDAGANLSPGQGALAGIAKAQKEVAAAKQQKMQNMLEGRKMTLEEQKTAAMLQQVHNETIQQQRAIQKQDEDLRKQSLTDGQNFVKTYEDNGYGIEKGLTLAELQKREAVDPDYAKTHQAVKNNETPSLGSDSQPKKDASGNIIYSPSYAVIDISHPPQGSNGEIKTTQQMHDYFKTNNGVDIPVDTMLPAVQVASLTASGQKVADANRVIEKANGEALDAQLRDQIRTDLQNPGVIAGLNKYPGRPIKGVGEMIQTVQAQTDKIAAQVATLQKANPNDPRLPAMQQDLKDHQQGVQALNRVQANAFSDKAREDEQKAVNEDEKARHDAAQEALQNRRADIQAQKETQQKGLGQSYAVENREFDTVRKPLTTSLDAFSTLRSSLDQGTAAGDSVVAPALLKALVAGGGVRITQAEINNFTHGRSSLEDMKGVLQKMTNGKSITPVQRQQVYSLLGAVESKVRAKNDILNDAQDALDNAQTVADQRKAVSDARRRLDAIDKGETVLSTTAQPNKSAGTPGADPFAQFGGKAH